MVDLRYLSAAVFVCLMQVGSAIAADIGSLRTKSIDLTLRSAKQILELERCLIEADGPGLPVVYRQPDRPNSTTIAWSQGMGVPMLVELTTDGSGSKLEIRTPRLPIRKAAIPKSFSDCL